jgi:hypothetical protein
MAEPTDIEERLDRVESRFAIADLVHTYARHVRYDEPEELGGLFTEDGVFEVRDGHPDRPEFALRNCYDGREAIHAHFAGNKGKPHPIPLIRNLIIELDGDTARSTCVMDGRIYGSDIYNQGEYRDEYRRIDGRWYFSHRIYTIFRGLDPA